MKTKNIMIFSLAASLILVLSGCSIVPMFAGINQLQESPQKTQEVVQEITQVEENIPGGEDILAIEGTLEKIYDDVNPSVVNIRVVKKISPEDMKGLQIPKIPFFGLPQEEDQNPEQYQSGLGSGFVWDQQGHIVTNNHVIHQADKIEVTFSDGTIEPAELVGTDPDSDLAVLEIKMPDGITPLQLADSNKLKVGQLAIAIGNPFGLSGTMTVGIVSALGRSLPLNEELGVNYTIPDIIQTDAPINPGNSGGVLVNDLGFVIGVTAAIESPVGANAGIGFAIPSAIVCRVVPALINDGRYDHSWLGISGTSLVPDLATAMNLDSTQRGALVVDVMPNSPAEDAGLKGSDRQIEIEGIQVRVGGDVITAIDTQPINEMDDLIAFLAGKTEVGQEVSLTIIRNGKEETISLTLASRPNSNEMKQAENGNSQGVQLGIYGLDVNEEITKAMDLPKDRIGVLVEQVEVGSPADHAGIKGSFKPFTIDGEEIYIGGDIIVAISDQSISGMQELRTILSQMDAGTKTKITLLRDGEEISVPVVF